MTLPQHEGNGHFVITDKDGNIAKLSIKLTVN